MKQQQKKRVGLQYKRQEFDHADFYSKCTLKYMMFTLEWFFITSSKVEEFDA